MPNKKKESIIMNAVKENILSKADNLSKYLILH